MPRTVEGKLIAEGKRFAIVAARWNSFFGEALLAGAIEYLVRHGAREEDITVYRCPGCYELPMVADRVAQKGGVDAIICLGILIRGSTIHFDLIASQAASNIARVSLDRGLPVSFGVLTCETLEQTAERSGSKAGNKGAEAAEAAVELVNLYDAIDNT